MGAALGVDDSEWGLDHGTWSVLKPMFPQASIPVLQLSMDYSRAPAEHYALGQQLKSLRERGVLIVGSGNVVHNLRLTRRGTAANEAYDWAAEFDTVVQDQIKKGELGALQDFQKLGPVARQAHPTHEHYLPLLYAAGAVHASEMPRFFNTGYQSASISMRSVLCTDKEEASRVLSQLKIVIRTNYSNPPIHGGAVVAAVLNNPELRAMWEQELAEMRVRIKTMRQKLVDGLKAAGVKQDMSFITTQIGMFSYSGLSKDQMVRLRNEFGVYGTDTGRMCVAALNSKNIDYVCQAIAKVV